MNRDPDATVAYALELTYLCQALHCLPRPGGLLDQDARDVMLMKTVLIVQAEKEERETKQMQDRAKSKGR